jgi:hypothetical protein
MGFALFMLSNNMSSCFSPALWFWFPRENDVPIVYATIYFVVVVALSKLCVFIYTYWCPTPFPYQMIFVLFNSYTFFFVVFYLLKLYLIM